MSKLSRQVIKYLTKTNKCKMCGMCCRTIAIEAFPEHIESMKDNINSDWKFIFENFVHISDEEAVKINPFMNQWQRFGKKHYYSCKMFNENTNKCTCHDAQPYVCSGYPYYTKFSKKSWYILNSIPYSPKCGFRTLVNVNINKYKNEVKHR